MDTEQIGKVILDKTYYSGADLYCDGEVEDTLLSIAQNTDPKDFAREIAKQQSWPVLYHLSAFRENIVSWLPIEKGAKVLEIGSGCGAVTGALARRAGSVTCVDLSRKRSLINAYRHKEYDNITIKIGNFKDIEPSLDTDYDYVFLIGVFEYAQGYMGTEDPYPDFLKIVQKHCAPDGRIVIAIENQYGLKYFAGCMEDHLGTYFSGIEDYPGGGGVRTFGRDGLIRIMRRCGIEDYHFYYPYPDYKFMSVVYSDDYLPRVGELTANMRNFDRERMKLFDEKNVYDGLIREGRFAEFSNSFLIVIGKKPQEIYAKFSNDRAPRYAICTKICEEAGVRRVEKYPDREEAREHIEGLLRTYERLREKYEGSGLCVNVCKPSGEGVCLEYVSGKTLEEALDECLYRNDEDGFLELLDRYERIAAYHEEQPFSDYDLIFSNVLLGEKWTLIDYEWVVPEAIGAQTMTKRAMFVYAAGQEIRRRWLFRKGIAQRFGISPDNLEALQEKENEFQHRVTEKGHSLAELYDAMGQPVMPVGELVRAERELDAVRIFQVYEDDGSGFREEKSYFPSGVYRQGGQIRLRVRFGQGIKRLRLDPALRPCMLYAVKICVNGREAYVKTPGAHNAFITPDCKVEINGFEAAGGALVFQTNDPNLIVDLENMDLKQENELTMDGEMILFSEDAVKSLYPAQDTDIDSAREKKDRVKTAVRKTGDRSADGERGNIVGSLKQIVKHHKLKQCKKEHDTEVMWYQYQQWIHYEERGKGGELYLTQETGDMADAENPPADEKIVSKTAAKRKLTVKTVDFEEAGDGLFSVRSGKDIAILVNGKRGKLADRAAVRIRALFEAHPGWDMIYGDEDCIWNQNRLAPWFKPDYSPDTLLAFPYFGGCVAVRRERFADLRWHEGDDGETRVYDFLLKCAETGAKIVHVPEVFFHREINGARYDAYGALDKNDLPLITADGCMPWELPWADQEKYREIRTEAMKRRGYPGKLAEDSFGILQAVYEVKPGASGKNPLVSIIIPSKDHADILERCIRSIRIHENYRDYEILVVDNGSRGTEREKIAKLSKRLSFSYFYEPMEFNFSAMINYGAARASGEYLLLLNDDCEVIQDDWLSKMLGQAQLAYVGAVGAKLLYPNSDLIQHAGVTNMAGGPAHKLQQNSDSRSYYFGKNRVCCNYIAVTAACLLISKEKFDAVGGFFEGLKVAFNDVDFCFALYERGFYHVMRNDVILYHHESLSRGDDRVSSEKTKRMLDELEVLYDRHPKLYKKDPFYSVNLFGHANDYMINYWYETEYRDISTKVISKPVRVKQEWYNESLMITVEDAEKIHPARRKEQSGEMYRIKGWAYVLNQDNCRYAMRLLLKKESGTFLEAQIIRVYRHDVVKVLPQQKNVEMSGFVANLSADALAPGRYEIYLLMADRCSRQRLLKDSGEVLIVGG